MRYHARLPPSASISFHLIPTLPPSLSPSPRPLILVLRAASFFARRIQFLPSRTHSQSSPPTSRTQRSHIDFEACHPRKHSFTAFQYHALTRPPFLSDPRPYVSFEPRIEMRHRINLFRSTVRAAAGSRELSSEHGDSGKANDESEIDIVLPFLFQPILTLYVYICVMETMNILFKMLYKYQLIIKQ